MVALFIGFYLYILPLLFYYPELLSFLQVLPYLTLSYKWKKRSLRSLLSPLNRFIHSKPPWTGSLTIADSMKWSVGCSGQYTTETSLPVSPSALLSSSYCLLNSPDIYLKYFLSTANNGTHSHLFTTHSVLYAIFYSFPLLPRWFVIIQTHYIYG